ncbi:large proline-rich protein BAG6 isoform X1 [Copidosoma floridanum]|uniref:large proline-rich protein BAG6 isoform X1 n=1 Tax=Copidosoma floridanum TaxID=29053 RepID=UPI0006C9907F|nr:large proline-rich protein BAG6 isoform X1 [Copidosoma floridanum]
MLVTVKTLDSQNHSVNCDENITVRGFKEHIADIVSVPADSQRLIFCGRVLQDDKKLSDYGDVDGKVVHLVQRPPPQPDTPRNSSNENSRQSNGQWTQGGSRVQYRGLHRNAMYLGAMSMPAEVVEGHGLPTPQLSNTLSNSRLVCARRMLNKAMQLMDRLDDPSIPLHPSPTENSASEAEPQATAPEDEAEQDSSINRNENARIAMEQAASAVAAAFSSGSALINIRLSQENEDGPTVNAETVARAFSEPSAPPLETSESEEQEPERSEPQRSENGRAEPSASTSGTSRRASPQVPRPPLMAELLERLIATQDRLRPYIERYRALMSADPALTSGQNGPEGVTENQRIVDGVSECLHYLSHANHALSDIIVDMGQQPPRNLRCRPIVIQHSAILQTGIPIQVETIPVRLQSHVNVTARNSSNNNNATNDEGNEATRPSSPTSGTQDQTGTPNSANSRSTSHSTSGPNQASVLGTLLNLNLPSSVEVSMELSPQSTMEFSSSGATNGSENDQAQNSNSNGANAASNANATPMTLIRDALQSILSGRHAQVETSNGGATINATANMPAFMALVGQQMDIGTANSGQSTQARSNIGTHPTTSTQTRSTARPHVLHPHTHPLNVGMGMGQSLEFDLFLPCNSHHLRRQNQQQQAETNVTTSQASPTGQQAASSENRSQSSTQSSSTSRTVPLPQEINFTIDGDANAAGAFLDSNRREAFASGLGLAMTLSELFQSPSSDVRISVIGSDPNGGEMHFTPTNDIPLADLLRTFNIRHEEFTGRDFMTDLWLFVLRNITFNGLMQISTGQTEPLVRLRRPFREFLEHSFPNTTVDSLQEQVVEQVVSFSRLFLQVLDVPQEQAGRRVDIPGTIEVMLRKFCSEFLKVLFNNDFDNITFAQEVVNLVKKLEDQSSAVLQYTLSGGQTAPETIASRFINQLTEGLHPLFQQTLLGVLSGRIHTYVTRTSQLSQEEIASMLVFKDEPSAPPEEVVEEESNESQPQVKEEPEIKTQPLSRQNDQMASPKKKEVKKETVEIKPEPMETDSETKTGDSMMDLAEGEEIPETFPGAEHLPPHADRGSEPRNGCR